MNTSGLMCCLLYTKNTEKLILLGSSNLQHKYGTGRKLCKKKSEHSTDPAVLLKLSNLSLYTQMYLHSFINRSRNHRSGNSLLRLMSVLLWIMLVYVYFSNCFLLRTFQIKCTLVPNYYSQWLQFFHVPMVDACEPRLITTSPSLILYTTQV